MEISDLSRRLTPILACCIALTLVGVSKDWSQAIGPPRIQYATVQATIADSAVDIIQIDFMNTDAKAVVVRLNLNGISFPLLQSQTPPLRDGVAVWFYNQQEQKLNILTSKRGISGSISVIVAVSSVSVVEKIECVGFNSISPAQNRIADFNLSMQDRYPKE